MKLDIYFRDKKMGTITVHGNGVIYNEGEDRIKKIIVYYQKSSREGDLAQRIQRGLHDNWHTQIVSDPDAAPLEESLHQSMALALPEEATFGMVGDEWHGPTAPGPGWVQVGQGERGGKVWKQQGQRQQAQQPQRSFKAYTDAIKSKIASGDYVSAWKMASGAPTEAIEEISAQLTPEEKNALRQGQSGKTAKPQAAQKPQQRKAGLTQGADRDPDVKVHTKDYREASRAIFPAIESMIQSGVAKTTPRGYNFRIPDLYNEAAKLNGGYKNYSVRQFVADLKSVTQSDENMQSKSFSPEPAVIETTKNIKKSFFIPRDIHNPMGEGSYYQALNFSGDRRMLTEASLPDNPVLRQQMEGQFGMVGDEWHGPTAPGPGWVQVGQGERGGKVWKQQQGAQPQPTPGAEPAPAPQQPGQIDPQLQQMLQSLDPDQVQEVMQFVTKMQARGQRKPGAAKVPEAKSAEAEQVFTQIRGLFDEIDQGTINNDKIIKALNSLQGLSLPQIHHVLDDLQIAEKPPSKKKAVAIVEMVISHQVEARERSHFQNPVLDQQAGGQ